MGIFDKIKANLAEAKRISQVHHEMKVKAYEADKKRPSVTELEFTVLDPSFATDPRYTNSGYIKEVGVDAFLKCIGEGKCEYVEVVVPATNEVHVDTRRTVLSDDDEWIYRVYCKVADLNGTVYRETIISSKDSPFKQWPNAYWNENYTNPDVVSVEGLAHAYVLHYFMDGTEYYLVVDPDEFNDLSKVFLRLKNRRLAGCLEPDNSCDFWWK